MLYFVVKFIQFPRSICLIFSDSCTKQGGYWLTQQVKMSACLCDKKNACVFDLYLYYIMLYLLSIDQRPKSSKVKDNLKLYRDTGSVQSKPKYVLMVIKSDLYQVIKSNQHGKVFLLNQSTTGSQQILDAHYNNDILDCQIIKTNDDKQSTIIALPFNGQYLWYSNYLFLL